MLKKSNDYPFDLSQSECAISFIENGETKYFKTTNLNEVVGIYYENGLPLVNDDTLSTVVAFTEDDKE